MKRRFVRITFQECEGGLTAFESRGSENEIQLTSGWLHIGDDRLPEGDLFYEIVNGELRRVP